MIRAVRAGNLRCADGIGNATIEYQTPEVGNPALRAIASDWRLSGVLNTSSGNWLSVTTTSNPTRTGIAGQRPDQVNSNPYGDKNFAESRP